MSTARWMHSHHLLGLWVPTAESKPFSPPWVTLSLPAPLPPTGQFGVGTRGWSHISFPLSSHSKLQGSCQSDQGRRTGYPRGSGPLAPPQDTAQLPSAPHQPHLDRLKGEDSILPGIEDLQYGS